MCEHGFPFKPYISYFLFSLSRKKIGWNVVNLNIDIYHYWWYICFINSPEHLKRFQSYLNSRLVNISFTIENKKDNKMPFLSVNIIHEHYKFTTSAYRKLTFNRIYIRFDSFLCFRICLNWLSFLFVALPYLGSLSLQTRT